MARTNQIHSGFDLIDGHAIDLEETLGTDDTYTGITCYGQAYENLAQWDICYRNDVKWGKADANAVATMPAIVMATEAINADGWGIFLIIGFVRNDGWAAWTEGGLLYADESTAGTAGGMIQTHAGFAAGDQVQVLGIALQEKIILFNPSYELVAIS